MAALLLLAAGRVLGQLGCRLTLSNCTSHGVCRQDGLCICEKGYIGDNCEMKVPYTEVTADLGKGFIAGWVIFWIAVNLAVPYLLYLLLLYCRKGNSSEVKEHFWDCYEANCCCLMPPNVRARRERDRLRENRDTPDSERGLQGRNAARLDEIDPMAPGYSLPSAGSKPLVSQVVETDGSRPVTAADRPRKERDSLMQSQNLHGAESRPHLLESSRLVQAENFIRKQSDVLRRQNIPRVTDQVSIMQQMYQYEDLDDFDDEGLEQDINEEERLLKIAGHVKYKEMVALMYE